MSFRSLDSILLAQGRIAPEDASRLAAEAEKGGLTMEQAILASGLVAEEDMLAALGEAYGLNVLTAPTEAMIDGEIIRSFTITYLKKHGVVPLKGGDGGLLLAMPDPSGLALLPDMAFMLDGKHPTPVLMPAARILEAVNKVFGEHQGEAEVSDVLGAAGDGRLDALDDDNIEDLLDDTNDAPFIKLVNMVLAQSVRAGASDVHVEPYKDVLRVRFRLDGVLYDKHTIPKRYHAAIVSRIKIMAKLNIAEKRLPQDGRIALTLGGRQVDLRVSTLPTSYGERVVMRLLEKSSRVLSLAELGLADDDLATIHDLSALSHGIILVTGPTGSGKTTSLYAALNHINSPDKNILTIEDPVEYQLEGVGQIQVNHKIGLTFANGLRSIVRQDPDVILIGEIRDKETADIAIQSALTGHLVFSTLHTNDAPSAVTRLIDMGVEPFLLSSVLRAVLAQRLVRVLCPHCRSPYQPDAETLGECGPLADQMQKATLYNPEGCSQCLNTGYKGRKAIYEIMEVTDSLRRIMLRTADSNELRQEAVANGMRTLKGDGCLKAMQGITSLTEVTRVTNL